MTQQEISELVLTGRFPEVCDHPELVETHISWVILCNDFVYKIKKPILYSFLDFSTVEKRKYYCEREIELNKRLTDNIYLDVQTVRKIQDKFVISGQDGEETDYAVRMRKVDRERQMDALLFKNKVTSSDIRNLAEKIAMFHKNATVIHQKDFLEIQNQFNDLGHEKDYLNECLDKNCSAIISRAIEISDSFVEKNKALLSNRLKSGFFRDCHGDLHSRNIFLLPSPQPFDCIEFNDDFRQIDVLNEVAFLCMDLDAFGRKDLSDLFQRYYNNLFPSITTDNDWELFIYYKSYRSNIRAKVNSLRAKSTEDYTQRNLALAEVKKYLLLMDSYMALLENK